MPSSFGSIHNEALKNYISKGDTCIKNSIGYEPLLAINKSGNMTKYEKFYSLKLQFTFFFVGFLLPVRVNFELF